MGWGGWEVAGKWDRGGRGQGIVIFNETINDRLSYFLGS